MKKLSLLLFWILFSTVLSAQSIVVESFKHDEKDLDANLEGTIVRDQNGEKCALIKVRSTPHANGFTFNVGQLGVMKVVDKETETWLYVPYGVRQISIFHPQLGRLDDYDLGMSVKKASTYILSLRVGRMQTIIEEEFAKQYLRFEITPANAFLEVNGDIWSLQDGSAAELLDYGRYEYRITAKDYHSEVGVVELGSNKETVKVTLRPAHGWLEIKGESNLVGAKAYVDNEFIGTVPFKSDKLSSGQHTLRIANKMYKDYVEKITISDNEVLTISPKLVQNFATVTIKTLDGAEIWIDHERRGLTSWTGRLEYGDHEIETKKASHRSQKKIYSITSSFDNKLIDVIQPIPVYGSLCVETKPHGSSVYLNGELKGETPLVLPKLLIGDYMVEVKKQAKSPLIKNITIKEKETCVVSETLAEGLVTAILKSPVSGVDIYIDNAHYSMSGNVLSDEFCLGEHEVIVSKSNYYQQKYKFEITHSGQVVHLPEIKPIVGTLVVDTKPDGSFVYIDGVYKGTTPLGIQIPIGNHKVKVSSGYEITEKNVTITANPAVATLGGSLKKSNYSYSKTLKNYYDNAGSWNFNLAHVAGSIGTNYSYELGAFSIRYKMIELRLLNFLAFLPYNENFAVPNDYMFAYAPTARLILPFSAKWATYVGIGPTMDIIDLSMSFSLEAGFRFDCKGATSVDFFVKYFQENREFTIGVAWNIFSVSNGDYWWF